MGAGTLMLLKDFSNPDPKAIILLSSMLAGVLFFMAIIEQSLRESECVQCMYKKGIVFRGVGMGVSLLVLLALRYLVPSWIIFGTLNVAVWGQVMRRFKGERRIDLIPDEVETI